jgi:hypothetical protein
MASDPEEDRSLYQRKKPSHQAAHQKIAKTLQATFYFATPYCAGGATWPTSVCLIVPAVITFIATMAAPETAGKELS